MIWRCIAVLGAVASIWLSGAHAQQQAGQVGSPATTGSKNEEKLRGPDLEWAPPNADSRLKSLSRTPPCDLPDVLQHAAAKSLILASNLEKFTAHEHIAFVMLDRNGMLKDFDSGSFDYVYAMEPQKGGAASREYRTPVKGSHVFLASGLDVGEVAIALIFRPDFQPDYEMKCEGTDERNGQADWVVHFQQRKDKPRRTVRFWVDNDAYPARLKGRAWIQNDNFQVVHLEANLMGDLSQIGLQEFAVSADYKSVQNPSENLELWLANHVVTYTTTNFDARRMILAHNFSDFRLFKVKTKINIQGPKEP
jgi:hypothetical protein